MNQINLPHMSFVRDSVKNLKLQQERGVSFEQIVFMIQQGYVEDLIPNPSGNHSSQLLWIIKLNEYVYCVPCVIDENICILKTIFPARKYHKIY